MSQDSQSASRLGIGLGILGILLGNEKWPDSSEATVSAYACRCPLDFAVAARTANRPEETPSATTSLGEAVRPEAAPHSKGACATLLCWATAGRLGAVADCPFASASSVWDGSYAVWVIDSVMPERHDFSLTRQRITFSRMGHLQINLSTILYHSGLSQARLARRTGLRPGTISDLVSGSAKRVEFSTLTRILDGLWDELGRPFSIEDLLHFESERLETQPDGTVIATDQYGLRWYVLEDGLYRPVPRTHL